MAASPNIVLVHGAWADGSCWSAVIERLQADGYRVSAPQLPETSLADDVARVRQVLARQSGPTILAAHSYGGQVITSLGTDAPNVVGLGEGLAEVLEGAAVVVDASNSPSFEDEAVMNFFTTSTTNLLAAEADAGVRHHVALSVVGTERLAESGYMRAKLAQEKLIGSPAPRSSRSPSSSAGA